MNGPSAPAATRPGEAAQAQTDPAAVQQECWNLLSALHLLRAHIWLGVRGEPSLGLSVIVGVQPDDGSFLIDALRDLVGGLAAGTELYFEAALVIALAGFTSTSAVAKFLMRGEVIE